MCLFIAVKYVNAQTHVVLIRVCRRAHHLMLSALATEKKIGQVDAFYRTLHVGGKFVCFQEELHCGSIHVGHGGYSIK